MELDEQVRRQLEALGQKIYEIGMMRFDEGIEDTLRRSDFRTPHQVMDHLYRYRNFSANGENIYVRATPDAIHGIIFLDDVTPDAQAYLEADGIIPASVVETSRTPAGVPRLHCWYRLAWKVDRPTRKAIEYVLITRLHGRFPNPDPKQCPGDFGSNDGGHYGRLAGFHNHGLRTPRDCPTTLVSASGHILSPEVTEKLIQEATPHIDRTPKKKDFEDLDEIRSRPYEKPRIVTFIKEKVYPKIDPDRAPFEQDFWMVCYLLKSKFSQADVKKALLELTPNPIHEGRKRNPPYYLDLTMTKALKAVKMKREVPLTQPDPIPDPEHGGAACVPAPAGAGATHEPSAPLLPDYSIGTGSGQLMTGKITVDGQILFGLEQAAEAKPGPSLERSGRPRLRRGILNIQVPKKAKAE